MTLGLMDLSPWAGNKGEPRAWHDLKYLGHTFEIRENPKGNQNTSAIIILNEKPTLQGNVYPSGLGLLKLSPIRKRLLGQGREANHLLL